MVIMIINFCAYCHRFIKHLNYLTIYHLMKRFANFVETSSHRDKVYESLNKTWPS